MLKLMKSRICTPSSHLCFIHIARYAHETSDANLFERQRLAHVGDSRCALRKANRLASNLTHICDPDFNIFY